MKRITQSLLAAAAAIVLAATMTSCDTTFENPNAASEDQVISTVAGLKALTIGMRREYTVTTLSAVVRSAGLSTREFAVVVGFTNPQEIELGGTALPSENGILTGLWRGSYRVMGMADLIIDNSDVVGEDATRRAYRATGLLFKAMALGNLAQFYEQLPISIDPDGDGVFRPRTEALQEAVQLLQDALSTLGSSTVPDSFNDEVLGSDDFDLRQVINAFIARYQLFLGNNSAAITAADAALTGGPAASVWSYDDGNSNENPLYLQTTEEPATYRPVDNFGFDPAEFIVDPGDGRLAFYMSPRDEIGERSRIPVETMRGFYDEIDEPIPVYLPGEMHLTKAEAYARDNNLGEAVTSLNAVLTKTDDPFGVNAGLAAYSGPQTQEAILEAIYRHRRIETFLSGMSLEDSRRFNRPAPPDPATYESFNRNRNFYPYPQAERDNNPNTPTDPTI